MELGRTVLPVLPTVMSGNMPFCLPGICSEQKVLDQKNLQKVCFDFRDDSRNTYSCNNTCSRKATWTSFMIQRGIIHWNEQAALGILQRLWMGDPRNIYFTVPTTSAWTHCYPLPQSGLAQKLTLAPSTIHLGPEGFAIYPDLGSKYRL